MDGGLKDLKTEWVEPDWDVVTRITGHSMPTAVEIEQTTKDAVIKLEEYRRQNQRPVDVFVMTTSQYTSLVKKLGQANQVAPFSNAGMYPPSLIGLELEHYATQAEVARRVAELRIQGKRVGIIAETSQVTPIGKVLI